MAKVKLTKKNIITCAFNMIDDKGIRKFSARKLAAQLGVSHMTIYSYISWKSIISGVVEKGFELINNQLDVEVTEHLKLEKDPVEIYLLIGRNLLSFSHSHPNIYSFMFSSDGTENIRNTEAVKFYNQIDHRIRDSISSEKYDDFFCDKHLYLLLINAIILSFITKRHTLTSKSCSLEIERSFNILLGSYRGSR